MYVYLKTASLYIMYNIHMVRNIFMHIQAHYYCCCGTSSKAAADAQIIDTIEAVESIRMQRRSTCQPMAVVNWVVDAVEEEEVRSLQGCSLSYIYFHACMYVCMCVCAYMCVCVYACIYWSYCPRLS